METKPTIEELTNELEKYKKLYKEAYKEASDLRSDLGTTRTRLDSERQRCDLLLKSVESLSYALAKGK